MTFAQRLRTAQIHPDATPSREKRNYFDRSALNDQFGEEATERSLELTGGRGYNQPPSVEDTAKLFD